MLPHWILSFIFTVLIAHIDRCYADGPLGELEPLEQFHLELDWNPSSCYDIYDDGGFYDECEASRMVDAFTISQKTAQLVNRYQNNSRCWNESSSEALEVGSMISMIPQDTRDELSCVYQNAGGSDEDLWKDVYDSEGSCTGVPPVNYFDLVLKLYKSIGLNRIAQDFGAGETVDRDSFLDYLNERIGRKVSIVCDPATRILRWVVVCIDPKDPYLIQDCTMDRDDPDSADGISCRGELRMPRIGTAASDSCAAVLYTDPAPALAPQANAQSILSGYSLLLAMALILGLN